MSNITYLNHPLKTEIKERTVQAQIERVCSLHALAIYACKCAAQSDNIEMLEHLDNTQPIFSDAVHKISSMK